MIGQMVSHYRILGTLGSGGMSVVYKAQDTRLGRFVALKFLLEKFCADRDFIKQFEQEARTASTLNDPGICIIHDFDQHRNRPFIVLEYLEGQTVAERLRQHGFTTGEAVGCGMQIATALSKAHEVGIVHRDINPANLFMTKEGRIKLLDFGIAKSPFASASDLEGRRRTLTGTLPYMSPEQALGDDVDAQSDIFSVGVVLYEMLSGRRPFRGSGIATIIDRIINVTPDPIGKINPCVPILVQNIVSRCLEKRPASRYQKAAELRNDLAVAAMAISSSGQKRKRTLSESTDARVGETVSVSVFRRNPS
jgi:serine/threonine protein kinase